MKNHKWTSIERMAALQVYLKTKELRTFWAEQSKTTTDRDIFCGIAVSLFQTHGIRVTADAVKRQIDQSYLKQVLEQRQLDREEIMRQKRNTENEIHQLKAMIACL